MNNPECLKDGVEWKSTAGEVSIKNIESSNHKWEHYMCCEETALWLIVSLICMVWMEVKHKEILLEGTKPRLRLREIIYSRNACSVAWTNGCFQERCGVQVYVVVNVQLAMCNSCRMSDWRKEFISEVREKNETKRYTEVEGRRGWLRMRLRKKN